ncbi:MAG: hypothetical protein ACO1SX_25620 [Actinomycetota bacterium]
MNLKIEAALRPLTGEPLTDMWRYAGCQKFEFGVQRPARNSKGVEITRADYGLVVSCEWRIDGRQGRVVSSEDFGPGENRRDAQAGWFYGLIRTDPPVIGSIRAGADGALSLRMTQGLTLEVIPTAEIEPDDEQWRFMCRGRDPVVLFGSGLDEGANCGP